MAMFNSYVKLPQPKLHISPKTSQNPGPRLERNEISAVWALKLNAAKL